MTTNYRCLRNIYGQRRNHRLEEWQIFCDWIEGLPLADKLITVGLKEGRNKYTNLYSGKKKKSAASENEKKSNSLNRINIQI